MKNVIKTGMEVYSGLPTWAKGVVVVGGTAVSAIILFTIYGNIKKTINRKKLNQLATDAGKDLQKLSQQGIRPTITQTQAQAFAATLVSAFDDCGTDEDAVYRVMALLKNDADLLFLIKVYGLREFKGCFKGSNYFGSEELSLPGAITYEMSSSEVSKVNAILQKTGINYKF
jgi:hypothetical protein